MTRWQSSKQAYQKFPSLFGTFLLVVLETPLLFLTSIASAAVLPLAVHCRLVCSSLLVIIFTVDLLLKFAKISIRQAEGSQDIVQLQLQVGQARLEGCSCLLAPMVYLECYYNVVKAFLNVVKRDMLCFSPEMKLWVHVMRLVSEFTRAFLHRRIAMQEQGMMTFKGG